MTKRLYIYEEIMLGIIGQIRERKNDRGIEF